MCGRLQVLLDVGEDICARPRACGAVRTTQGRRFAGFLNRRDPGPDRSRSELVRPERKEWHRRGHD